MLNVHHENEHWLKIQEMFECLKTLTSSTNWMICCIICCYIHIRRGTFCMNHQLCMAADHCSSRFINRIFFLSLKYNQINSLHLISLFIFLFILERFNLILRNERKYFQINHYYYKSCCMIDK